ncbi:nuA4 complex subunit EAF3 homolog isoform X2 [Acyrthosiphon pisum]|uniref:Chromo domain-containing protein n=1 Tax=Acyrthosiphon pisum TaxID=7029 RepID=A0A8R2ACM8_ACYPI|nr:nuA4 complex subunit EAF3 homolog isoform X2 [Acyrthosiphon pisum]|eukprot:XP_003246257.1 PREDICTED: nuA4 complex subunit EAF3 homolog isoform X2 [Acyrthosiphon pisum]
MADKSYQFAIGEKVFVYYNGLLYEAICLKRRKTDYGENQYFVHYKGFKNKWDEWSDEDNILPINEINMGHKERLESSRKNCKGSKRGKKSQEPRDTEDDSSPKPALRKRGRPKKNVDQSAEQAVGQSAEPVLRLSTVLAVEQSAESVVGKSAESDKENSAEPSVAESTAPAFEQSAISTVKDKPAVLAVANMVLNIIPRSKLLANELRKLVIPFKLKYAIELDCIIMHRQYNYASQKLLKFPEKNFLAQVIYTFTNSSYFIDDSQKIYSKIFCVTLMQYFNASVHKHLTYKVEKMYNLQCKAVECFLNRLRYQPHINYIYKQFLRPKYIWCYLYGPMFLLRLIVRLPKILGSTSMLPEYDSNTFVYHIKKLIRFLEDNFDTYFTFNDYIKAEEMV